MFLFIKFTLGSVFDCMTIHISARFVFWYNTKFEVLKFYRQTFLDQIVYTKTSTCSKYILLEKNYTDKSYYNRN